MASGLRLSEGPMADDVPGPVNLPLSGGVYFAPWVGQITVNVGQSSKPATEEKLIKGVASYGKQLGRIGDALLVLMKYLPSDLEAKDKMAIDSLKRMLAEIAAMKS
jgi:hypothetical protein